MELIIFSKEFGQDYSVETTCYSSECADNMLLLECADKHATLGVCRQHPTIIFKDLSGFICATFCLELKIVISKTFERKFALEELVCQVLLIKIAVNLEFHFRGNSDIITILF